MTAATALAASLVVWQIMALANTTDTSALRTAVVFAVAALAVAAALLTIAPRRLWAALLSRVTTSVTRLRSTTLADSPGWGTLLVAVGLVIYLVHGGWQVSQPDDPSDDDQGAFLQTAEEVHRSGGVRGLIADLYAGEFAEVNRHPLYIGLLSMNPTHEYGRSLSLVFGMATLAWLTRFAWRDRGAVVAGLFCVLLAVNGAFGLLTTRAVCDGLMVLWAGLVYALASRPTTLSRQAMIGGLLGLAYLTKGTGLLLLGGYVVWRIVEFASRRWLRQWFRTVATNTVSTNTDLTPSADQESSGLVTPRTADEHHQRSNEQGQGRQTLIGVGIVVMTWAVVSSPLLVRNARRFGSPTYNVNSYLLFVDAYEDPHALADRMSTLEAAQNYLDTHTLSDILRRETSGLVWETFIMLRLLGPAPLDDARVLFGLPLALFALIAVIANPRREHGLLAVWTVFLVTIFAWYIPIAAGERFPLPLLAPLLLLSAEGIVRCVGVRSTQASRFATGERSSWG